MAFNYNDFIGQWNASDGKVLVIKGNEQNILVDFFIDKSLQAAERILLSDKKRPSKNMKAYFENNELVVELGVEGLGPTLRLTYKRDENKEYIIPTVVMGMYDDWEDDFGVPWIFPLSEYERA